MTDPDNLPKNQKRTKLLLIVLLLVIMGLGAKVFLEAEQFFYAGTLEATKVDISSQLGSSIGMVFVNEGDHVLVDQNLVTLNCEDYKADAELANDNYERNYRLFAKGAISENELDEYTNRKKDADIRLKWCNVRSPMQGVVLNRYHEPGEFVTAGVKLLTLANIRDIWAYIYVPQPIVSQLKIGMKLTGIIPEMNHREFVGKIIKINDEAEFTPKNVQTRSERTRLVYGIKVSFLGANESEILKPGMTIEIKLPEN